MRSRELRWRHPELQPGWIDRPHQKLDLGDLTLESGEVIPDFEISYVTHGKLSSEADNAILVLTAIGSIHHRLDFLIGPNRPLNPERHIIICADAIGNGMTTSPSNSRTHPDLAFPRFCIRDMVASDRGCGAHPERDAGTRGRKCWARGELRNCCAVGAS
jgi:homoserine O-acetyltransferase